METSKLIKTFKILTIKDHRELEKLIRSPFFNQRDDVIRLFIYLRSPGALEDAVLKKEVVYQAVYPSEKFDDKKLRYLFSFLLDLIRQLFIQQELQKDPHHSQQFLSDAYRNRGLDQSFKQSIHQLKKVQEGGDQRDALYHYRNYRIGQADFEFASRKSRVGKLHLQDLSDELNTFFISESLKLNCVIQSHQNMWPKAYQPEFLDEVLRRVESNKGMNVPAVSIYYHCYQALSDPKNEADFLQLKELLNENWKHFPKSEACDLYMLAINYCIKKLNNGHHQYIQEAFELYRTGLENGVFLEQGYLSGFNFKNVLRLGLALKEFEWTERFLHEFKSYLHPDERENTYQYNLANFYFQKRDYEQAMNLLWRVDFHDAYNNMDARRMLLCMYYELKEFNALDSLLDSFKAYLHRQKGLGYHRNNYLNLVRFTRKLLNTDLRDQSAKDHLRKQMEDTERLAERRWLLQQLS